MSHFRPYLVRALVAIAVVLLVGLVALRIYRADVNHTQPALAESAHTGPILLPGIQEPEEMRVEPISVAVLTPPERMLGEAMRQVSGKSGPAALLPALNGILAKYPNPALENLRRAADMNPSSALPHFCHCEHPQSSVRLQKIRHVRCAARQT